ncbi:MAG: hypothetical protein NC433_05290 [Clostridiales bacterium]|nr:hypothetical protein [Clostridiales bacterium]
MRQETFKNMYNRISLSKEQKERIYEEIQTTQEEKHAEKRVRLTMRAASFALVFLISGMTVFAFEKFSLAERFAKAMNHFHYDSQLLTQEQRDFYEEYGQILGIDIATAYGTLRLEALMYDDNYIIIPYTYTMYTGEDDFNEDAAGISISNIYFFTESDMENMALWTSVDSMENGVRTGSFVLSLDTILSPGKTLTVARDNRFLDYSEEIILAEITLGKMVEKVNLAIDEESQKLLREKGLIIDEITMSPLSIAATGVSDAGIHEETYVVLKDGREVSASFGEFSTDNGHGRAEEGYANDVSFRWLFNEPIIFDNVEGIRLKTFGVEIWIPMEQSE